MLFVHILICIKFNFIIYYSLLQIIKNISALLVINFSRVGHTSFLSLDLSVKLGQDMEKRFLNSCINWRSCLRTLELLFCDKHCALHDLTHLIFTATPWGLLSLSSFPDQDEKAWTGEIKCLRPHKFSAELKFEYKSVWCVSPSS